MTPAEFIDKWTRADRTERQAAQEHFIDLCRVLGEPTPNEADHPDGYTFERGVSKIDGTGARTDRGTPQAPGGGGRNMTSCFADSATTSGGF